MRHGNIAVRIIEEFLSTSCGTRASVTRDTRVLSSQQDYQLERNVELWLPRTKQPSQRHWLQKLELQQSLRIHYCRASGMPIMRLARCLRWTVRLRWRSSSPRPCVRSLKQKQVPQRVARICADYDEKSVTFPKCFCSSFQ